MEEELTMESGPTRPERRILVTANYMCLIIMNFCFYMVYHYRDMTHWVDAIGLTSLLAVVLTFVRIHWRSGLWKLTHAGIDTLDERQVQVNLIALSHSYRWFTVLCLLIMMVNAVLYRLVPGLDLVITVPLVGSLIYVAHTLPGSVLAWTEREVPGELQ